jgi:hypothetical protein
MKNIQGSGFSYAVKILCILSGKFFVNLRVFSLVISCLFVSLELCVFSSFLVSSSLVVTDKTVAGE